MRAGQFSSAGRGAARGQGSRSTVETGYVDLASANYALDTTGSITLLNTVPQGVAISQRVGKRIALKSLQCHGNFTTNAASTITDVTMLIVYDKRPSGNLPAITDILVASTSEAFNNDVNASRFRILKRVDLTMVGSAANQYTAKSAEANDWFLSLHGLPQVFKAAGTGAIGDIEEGAIYQVTVGGTNAGTLAATVGSAFRVRYNDI